MSIKYKTAIDGWSPIRNGNIYCSPRCGGKCTHAAFGQATAEARALALLLGPGWMFEVWENLGWYYEAVKGVASVRPSIKGSALSGGWTVTDYCCTLNFITNAKAGYHVQISKYDRDPQHSVRFAIIEAISLTDRIRSDIGLLKDYVK